MVETAIQDGAYDNNKNFQFLSFRGIQPSMKIRKNSRCRKKTIITFEIRLYNHRKTNLQQWKASTIYGKRWMVEPVFFYIKRMLGD
ncbi:MAG: transposase [Nitrososphaeraceae archaeon]